MLERCLLSPGFTELGSRGAGGLDLSKSASKGHAISSVPEGKTVSKNDHPAPLGYLGGLETREAEEETGLGQSCGEKWRKGKDSRWAH